MKIELSKLASFKIESLLDYLESEWSKSTRERFLSELNSSLKRASAQPQAFPKSQLSPDLRKLVVTKQSTLLYTVQGDVLFVVTIFDSRQDPIEIEKEIIKNFG